MEDSKAIDKFGKFIVDNLRDKGINFAELLLKKHWKAPALQELQDRLEKLSKEDKNSVRDAVTASIDTAIHDFLFALQEQAGFGNDIQIIVDGKNIVETSDAIHGEAYSAEGWNAKFSKYPKIEQ